MPTASAPGAALTIIVGIIYCSVISACSDSFGFNVSLGHVWAEQERLLEKAGQRMAVEDSYIAATARRHGLIIATGNDRDFRRPGLKIFNPFKELV